MSTGYDANHDYTQEQAATAEDFEIAQVAAPDKSADQIESENSFDEIPPGQYQVVVVGFLDKPKAERKELYCDGQRYGIDTHSIVVKFALPEDRGKQVTDYMLLPPNDPGELYVYYNGTKNPGNKGKGFHANKFFHFLERLMPGIVQKGQALPPEACSLRNWIGRQVVCTIEAGDPYEKKVTDTETGQDRIDTRAGRNQVKLYSYREAGTPVSGPANPTAMRAPGTPATPTGAARPAAPARPATTQPAAARTTMPASQPAHGLVAPANLHPTARPLSPSQGRPAASRQPVATGAGDRGLSNI